MYQFPSLKNSRCDEFSIYLADILHFRGRRAASHVVAVADAAGHTGSAVELADTQETAEEGGTLSQVHCRCISAICCHNDHSLLNFVIVAGASIVAWREATVN